MHSYDSVESLIDGERESNIHVECSRPVTMRALDTVRRLYKNRRCAFYLRSDRGFDRDSVRSYLRFFGALSGTGRTPRRRSTISVCGLWRRNASASSTTSSGPW